MTEHQHVWVIEANGCKRCLDCGEYVISFNIVESIGSGTWVPGIPETTVQTIPDEHVAEALTIFGERERYSRTDAMRAVLEWALRR